ncbi:hypothetical protein FRAHR75_1540007 [Frankia sp. Hr75.2]|nr:hypothetical protein FRAHR75_1540007 [Frankia sp. Hr75.2]SQE00156.1 hypothetical protein FMEAI12_6190004 [Parafrankia sp. Ea1.12]
MTPPSRVGTEGIKRVSRRATVICDGSGAGPRCSRPPALRVNLEKLSTKALTPSFAVDVMCRSLTGDLSDYSTIRWEEHAPYDRTARQSGSVTGAATDREKAFSSLIRLIC